MKISKAYNKLRKRLLARFFLYMLILLCILLIFTPYPSFEEDYSAVLFSSEGEVLSSSVSKDEQWRYSKLDSVPFKFERSLLQFEDQYFYMHWGINPVSILRALGQNISAGKVVSGGSTLSMQIARMSRPGKSRTIGQKLIEMLMAIKLELFESKESILKIYASNAPFGGNTVGLEAASYRYYKRSPWELSWAESAALAILPNSPSLIYPGKNSHILREKRDRLLNNLYHEGLIDSTTLELSLLEDLPSPPDKNPGEASHLLVRLQKSLGKGNYHSTLSSSQQKRVETIIENFANNYKKEGINNISAIVLDLKTYSIKVYVGNNQDKLNQHGGDVDIITSSRSSGSILKPFLYSSALSDGTILPNSLLPDVPSYFGNFSPQNFNHSYDGMVAANDALIRSLNIPFIYLLQEYSIPAFYELLNNLGFHSFRNAPEYYGLSMILGGGEVSLWELTIAYGSIAKMLNDKEYKLKIRIPRILQNDSIVQSTLINEITAGAAWICMQNLTQLNRPDEEKGWKTFNSTKTISWKTGTSFGFRDAWAVGMNPEYVVAVWTGNADGEGVNGLTGTSKAAPIMFRIFETLGKNPGFFDPPYDDLKYYPVCKTSGNLFTDNCIEKDSILIPNTSHPSRICKYHKLIHLSTDKKHQVNSECYPGSEIVHEKFFVLPPKFEYYYKQKHSNYNPLPPFLNGCIQKNYLDFIYPVNGQKLYLPVDFDGKINPAILEAANRNDASEIRWFYDDQYLGETSYIHQMECIMSEGKHILTICDLFGNEKSIEIEVLSTDKK